MLGVGGLQFKIKLITKVTTEQRLSGKGVVSGFQNNQCQGHKWSVPVFQEQQRGQCSCHRANDRKIKSERSQRLDHIPLVAIYEHFVFYSVKWRARAVYFNLFLKLYLFYYSVCF